METSGKLTDFVVVLSATTALALLLLIAAEEARRFLQRFVLFTTVGLVQISTAFVIDKGVGFVVALEVRGPFVVAGAELVFGVVIVVAAETALFVLVE